MKLKKFYKGIPVELHARRGFLPVIQARMDEVTICIIEGLDFFATKFGVKYPFTKLDFYFLAHNKHAVSTPGCVFLPESCLDYTGEPHRLAKQYMEIMKSIAQIWLNGMTTSRDLNCAFFTQALSSLLAWIAYRNLRPRLDNRALSEEIVSILDRTHKCLLLAQLPSAQPLLSEFTALQEGYLTACPLFANRGYAYFYYLFCAWGQDRFFEVVRELVARNAWGNFDEKDFLTLLVDSERDVMQALLSKRHVDVFDIVVGEGQLSVTEPKNAFRWREIPLT